MREAAYKLVKMFFEICTPKCGAATENKNEEIIYEQEQTAEKWKEYTEALYNRE